MTPREKKLRDWRRHGGSWTGLSHRGAGPPEGYRWFVSTRPRPMLLHLSIDNGLRTLCGRAITAAFIEPSYTQRTKCRACWLVQAVDGRVHYHVGDQQAVPGRDCEDCR